MTVEEQTNSAQEHERKSAITAIVEAVKDFGSLKEIVKQGFMLSRLKP